MELRIGLRSFRKDDWEAIFAWVHDPQIKDNFRFTQKELSSTDIKKFVQLQMENHDSKDKHFVLYDLSDTQQKYIGSVGLKKIDSQDQNAELAIVISESTYRGKGYGQEALFLICEYAFQTLRLHKVYLTSLSHNQAAVSSYQKFGFEHEGLRKEQIYQHGQFYDEVQMGILQQAFTAKYTETE